MAEDKKKKRQSGRPRRTRGVSLTIHSVNGSAVPESVVVKLERAVEGVILESFNDGHRLVTQTIRA